MANVKEESLEQASSTDEATGSKPKKSMVKIGIPVIILQIIIAFFVANYFILPTFFDVANADTGVAEEETDGDDDEFGFIYNVEDVIVNPAESRGSQFVVINIAFEVKEEDDLAILEKREPKIRDILIRIISSKTVVQLDGADDKENLRTEIKTEIGDILAKGHLVNIYFVNYIIQ